MYLCLDVRSDPDCIDRFDRSSFFQEVIATLAITIIAEGIVAIGYSFWRKKPVRPLFFTTVCANLITQFMLWIVLNFFFQHYLVTLLAAEAFIWIAEGLALYFIPANRLSFAEAMSLGLSMNLVSFALGWFLPV